MLSEVQMLVDSYQKCFSLCEEFCIMACAKIDTFIYVIFEAVFEFLLLIKLSKRNSMSILIIAFECRLIVRSSSRSKPQNTSLRWWN